MAQMDGGRLRNYWNQEIAALLAAYHQFEILVPSPDTAGADHPGEDGRFVEELLRTYLRKYLPGDLEVLTGFILRPAVKAGLDTTRRSEADQHSGQLDIIVFDSARYPMFQRFGESVIVPPEGVVAVLSVKKTIRDPHIESECKALAIASKLCRQSGVRGPFLALVGPSSTIEKKEISTAAWIRDRMAHAYPTDTKFDDIVGLVTSLQEWAIFKAAPSSTAQPKEARLLHFELAEHDWHLPFQLILTGILSVYYDGSRSSTRRPGFTAFSRRDSDDPLDPIPCGGLR
jgi:hypothetical protein